MKKSFFCKMIKCINKKSNNEGSSIVLVVLTMAFVGILVAMSVYMSYYNYLMKTTDKQSKANFYTAEEALAVINAGLQTVVSESMAIAYNYALQSDASVNVNLRKINFELEYEKRLIDALAVSSSDKEHYKLSTLEHYLTEAGCAYDATTQVGAQILTTQAEGKIFKKEGGIVLQNVKLMYTDEKGFVTLINTDIRLRLPNVDLVTSSGIAEIENCSIVANDNLIVESNNNIRVSGNVYGGKNGLIASNDSRLSFEKNDNDAENVLYRLIAGKVVVENSTAASGYTLDVTKNYEVWTEAIDIIGGRMSLAGSAYVRDDLTVSGKDSNVTLAGNYFGYGDELYKSQNSSAIIVNGANTTLDFSGLENLTLAGHAYVGASRYDANNLVDDYIPDEVVDDESEDENQPEEDENQPEEEEENEIARNDKDLMMGESVGVKSNQLMYLVPTECMGYYYESSEQYLAKNPITYDEYLTLTETYQYERTADGQVVKDANGQPVFKLDSNNNKIPQFTEVNLNAIFKKLDKPLSSFGATYKPVFRRINGTVLVYYYLDFTSDKLANDFFAEYYEADKENLDQYIKMYINDFDVNASLNAENLNLHLAGNMIKYEADGTVTLVNDTATEDAAIYDELVENREQWNDSYTAYSKKLVSSTNLLTMDQLNNDIFDNLVVGEAEFASIVPKGTYQEFEAGAVKALVINNKDDQIPRTIGFDDVQGVSIILATGDLILDTNFKGLVLAGGTVELSSNCNIVRNDPVGVRQALSAKNASNKSIADLLLDGSAYLTANNVSSVTGDDLTITEQQIQREEDYIKISDLVVYENWTKQ